MKIEIQRGPTNLDIEVAAAAERLRAAKRAHKRARMAERMKALNADPEFKAATSARMKAAA